MSIALSILTLVASILGPFLVYRQIQQQAVRAELLRQLAERRALFEDFGRLCVTAHLVMDRLVFAALRARIAGAFQNKVLAEDAYLVLVHIAEKTNSGISCQQEEKTCKAWMLEGINALERQLGLPLSV
jgi:hypothetical protein